ncbi:putative reverse transcriptase domain-containing protein, partial [Tanacetum coccineum]
MPWTKMKQLMTVEFYPIEEIQRIEHKLWNLKVKDYNIMAYTRKFNELALMCQRMVKPESVKVDAYIRGLSENIKGEVTSSMPANLNEDVCMAHKLMEQKLQAKDERILEGKKQNLSGLAMIVGSKVIRGTDAQRKSSKRKLKKFVAELMLLRMLSRRVRMCSMLNIKPVKVSASYEVELADERVVSTNPVLKGCTLNLVNYLFEVDLMPIELGTFDVIIVMDWLVKHDAVIVYGEKFIRIPYGNKMLTVKSDKGVSRLKVISCIKAHKYIERGCHLFLAHVTEKKSKEKPLEDVP